MAVFRAPNLAGNETPKNHTRKFALITTLNYFSAKRSSNLLKELELAEFEPSLVYPKAPYFSKFSQMIVLFFPYGLACGIQSYCSGLHRWILHFSPDWWAVLTVTFGKTLEVLNLEGCILFCNAHNSMVHLEDEPRPRNKFFRNDA